MEILSGKAGFFDRSWQKAPELRMTTAKLFLPPR